jgi:hypothetical protein
MGKIEITDMELSDAADAAGVDVRQDYSGRGMYGETCIGVVGDASDCERFEAELAKAVTLGEFKTDNEHNPEDVLDVYMEKLIDIQDARRSDNMGTEFIYYYPKMKIEG